MSRNKNLESVNGWCRRYFREARHLEDPIIDKILQRSPFPRRKSRDLILGREAGRVTSLELMIMTEWITMIMERGESIWIMED